jgi:hypothetical protein
VARDPVLQARLDQLCCVRPIVDVGAGPGSMPAEAVRSRGSIVGDGSSRTRTRSSYVIGDVCNLPIGTETVGSLRCDRVIQHVADPRWPFVSLRDAFGAEDDSRLRTQTSRPSHSRCRACREISQSSPPTPTGHRLPQRKYVSALPTMLAALDFTEITVNAFPLVLSRQ